MGRSRHGDVYGVLGGGRLIDESRQGTLARLQLPHHRPSSAATVSVSPPTPNASASSLSGSWVWGAENAYPVWAAAQPAALSAPLYHASLFQAR